MSASVSAEPPSQEAPPLERMRAALAEIARDDAVVGGDAAALALVQLPDSEHAVLQVREDIRFNATLVSNLSHGELVRFLRSALTLMRLQGEAGTAAVPPAAP